MVEEARFLRNITERVIIEMICGNISPADLDALEENVILQELIVNKRWI